MHAVLSSENTVITNAMAIHPGSEHSNTGTNPLTNYQIIRRNGAVVPFEPAKIAVAMMKASWPFTALRVRHRPAYAKTVDGLTQVVIRALVRSRPGWRHVSHSRTFRTTWNWA
jgi:ribonucleoside-diphosphate reductase alpha chain